MFAGTKSGLNRFIMLTLIKNIKSLVQAEENPKVRSGKSMSVLPCIDNAFLLTEDELIKDYGRMNDCPKDIYAEVIDASGKFVFPSFCDSHSHLVYAGSREYEFAARIKGLSYEEIARRGGGILNSVQLLRNTSEDELFEQSLRRLDEIISKGTGTVEIKSGYGLDVENELKMLRVIGRLKDSRPVTVISTFLGAHAVPNEFKNNRAGYVDLIIGEMIPRIANEGLADFIDVFCDEGFFTVEDTCKILEAGAANGLRGKIHANELACSGGIQAGVKYDALSVDHLEFTGDDEIECLLGSNTMPTLLPGAALFLGMKNPPARKMIESGLPIALASDFNPGSSPSGDMKFVLSLACINLKMTVEEAINAATVNSAYAMNALDRHGSISRGKFADFFITETMPSYDYFPYAYTSNLIDKAFLKGKEINLS